MKTGLRFSPRMNRWFYSAFGVLFLSGGLWLLAQHGPVGTWLLRIHGAAAMLSLIILGVMIPSHMRLAWEQRRNRVTAVVMVSLCLLLVVSGYGLYYFGGEQLRSFISALHWSAGCVLPVGLLWHMVDGRKSRRKIGMSVRPESVMHSQRFTSVPKQVDSESLRT